MQLLESCALGVSELAWFDAQSLADQIRICDLSKRPGYSFARAVREIYRDSAQITHSAAQPRFGKVLMFRREKTEGAGGQKG